MNIHALWPTFSAKLRSLETWQLGATRRRTNGNLLLEN